MRSTCDNLNVFITRAENICSIYEKKKTKKKKKNKKKKKKKKKKEKEKKKKKNKKKKQKKKKKQQQQIFFLFQRFWRHNRYCQTKQKHYDVNTECSELRKQIFRQIKIILISE